MHLQPVQTFLSKWFGFLEFDTGLNKVCPLGINTSTEVQASSPIQERWEVQGIISELFHVLHTQMKLQ